jgi:3',5'-cyclic AMP phosphodiesterase CpdA
MSSAQLEWLENSLSASTARWKIAVFHHPIYSSGKEHGSSFMLREMLEPLFTQYHVNAVFSGHDHSYERTKLQQGIQYFVTGGGSQIYNGNVDLMSEFRAASFDKKNHFMLIEISDSQIEFQAICDNGITADRGIIN